jgi:Flp pilus assembly protein TadD
MRTSVKQLAVLCTGALLLACAPLARHPAPPATSADEAYLIARSAHLAGRYAQALSGYQSALLADPEHVNARNGLATLHAEQGALDQAIPLWRALTAQARGPESAFLFSNLGHAHYLNGDYDSALAALEKACLLDPFSERSWQRLGGALEKLGQHGRAQLMYKQAAALRAHDVRADYAVAAQAAASAAGQAPHPDADGVAERRRDASPQPAPGPGAARATLEIRNGNGIAGMARSLSKQMDPASVRVVRLSNQKGFHVRSTRVEFRPPFRATANRLAARFGHAAVVEAGQSGAPDLRLVLGRDLARTDVALRLLAGTAPGSFAQHQTRRKHARDNEADRPSTTGAQP